jgi:hypothetical protein
MGFWFSSGLGKRVLFWLVSWLLGFSKVRYVPVLMFLILTGLPKGIFIPSNSNDLCGSNLKMRLEDSSLLT